MTVESLIEGTQHTTQAAATLDTQSAGRGRAGSSGGRR